MPAPLVAVPVYTLISKGAAAGVCLWLACHPGIARALWQFQPIASSLNGNRAMAGSPPVYACLDRHADVCPMVV